jgi:serralysin
MKRLRGVFSASALLLLLARPAHCAFHLFDIQEIYSNADGSVQFIELFTTFSSQQFVGGHTIRFEIGTTVTNSISLTNLPGDTANKTFLAATSNFSALYGVTPDFIIPANFFSKGANNFINFAEGTDRVNLTNLPIDAVQSLNGLISDAGQTASSTAINGFASPRNFAGQTTTIPEPSSLVLLVSGAAMALRRRRPAAVE